MNKVALVYQKNTNRNYVCLLPKNSKQVEIEDTVTFRIGLITFKGNVLDIKEFDEDAFAFLMLCLNIKTYDEMPKIISVVKDEFIDWGNSNASAE